MRTGVIGWLAWATGAGSDPPRQEGPAALRRLDSWLSEPAGQKPLERAGSDSWFGLRCRRVGSHRWVSKSAPTTARSTIAIAAFGIQLVSAFGIQRASIEGTFAAEAKAGTWAIFFSSTFGGGKASLP